MKTVKELIEFLSKCNPESIVLIEAPEATDKGFYTISLDQTQIEEGDREILLTAGKLHSTH